MDDVYQDLEKLVKKELRTLTDKGSLSPSEVDAAKKAVCLLKMLEDDYNMEEMAEDREFSEAAYRGRSMRPMMRSYGREYGRSYGMYPEWNDGVAYEMMPMHREYSRARGRDARTGRYVSRDGRSMNRRSYAYARDGRSYGDHGYDDEYMAGRRMVISYDDGYSGHSIDDRIVDVLEKMMDGAVSDYEREKLNEVIRYVDSRRGA